MLLKLTPTENLLIICNDTSDSKIIYNLQLHIELVQVGRIKRLVALTIGFIKRHADL